MTIILIILLLAGLALSFRMLPWLLRFMGTPDGIRNRCPFTLRLLEFLLLCIALYMAEIMIIDWLSMVGNHYAWRHWPVGRSGWRLLSFRCIQSYWVIIQTFFFGLCLMLRRLFHMRLFYRYEHRTPDEVRAAEWPMARKILLSLGTLLAIWSAALSGACIL